MNKQNGFTLVEVMVVVGVIGALAVIATPPYKAFRIRSRVTEGLNLSIPIKTGVSDTFLTGTSLDKINSLRDASIRFDPTSIVSEITINHGVISIHYAADQVGGTAFTVDLIPNPRPNGTLMWTCAVSASHFNGYVPAQCRWER